MLNNLDFFKIRIVSEVAKTESVLRSSQTLRISPSAVSQNIKAIERSLGKQLFLRVGKRLKPTPLASEICRRSQSFFTDLSELLEGTQEQQLELRVGAPPAFGATLLVDRLTRFREANPGIRIFLSLMDTMRLLADLKESRLDFCFLDGGPYLRQQRELVSSPYFTEELVLCCSARFYAKHLKENCSYRVLKALPHIPYHAGKEGIYKWYQHHFHKCPDLSFNLAIDHPNGVLRALLKGWGLGVLPRQLVAEHIDRKEIKVICGPKGELSSSIYLAQLKERVPSRIEKHLIAELKVREL